MPIQGCYQSQNYKIWKQFTTHFESLRTFFTLLSITKLQNLKAIHNLPTFYWYQALVVINHKTTKFESNSQRFCVWRLPLTCCYQSQNYKIWKQFTTAYPISSSYWGLLSITKLQNLKAIHNLRGYSYSNSYVVINHKTTKFESNSQHLCPLPPCRRVVINHKTTKFESNSQLIGGILWRALRCYQSQNYKIWKQFTTLCLFSVQLPTLLSITKLQNLKAIHNFHHRRYIQIAVVINHKITKFESNSQRLVLSSLVERRCYQSQNYKIWKQFTTHLHRKP